MSDDLDRRIEEANARRAKARAALELQCKEQLVQDLEALENFELEYGPSNVKALRVNYAPGLPALAVVRVPSKLEIKRYQDKIKPSKKAEIGDLQAAAVQVGRVCLVYPAEGTELREALLDQRSPILVEAGFAAVALAESRDADEGKG